MARTTKAPRGLSYETGPRRTGLDGATLLPQQTLSLAHSSYSFFRSLARRVVSDFLSRQVVLHKTENREVWRVHP